MIRTSYRFVRELVFGAGFDPEIDVVLVTGGAGGLGAALVSEFVTLGARVAVLDTELPEPNSLINGVSYFEGDVTSPSDLLRVSSQIYEAWGPVSVVVNNAAVMEGGPLVDTSFESIQRTVNVNLVGPMYVNKVFLPAMIAQGRGYLVTVASTLGYMSPARLAAYGASKAGLVAMHESLTYELGGPSAASHRGVKTLLVCPGQMRGGMFDQVTTPSDLLAPELSPDEVATAVVRALRHGRQGELVMPAYAHVIPLFRALPWPVVELAREWSGIDTVTKVFSGEKPAEVVSRASQITRAGII
ncbi:hypothetical protein DICA0_E00232 [Diutina catenulata]